MNKELFDFTGKRVLVTGGSRGLGLEIAKAFSFAGANVVISGRNAEALNEIQTEQQDRGLMLRVLAADLIDEAEALAFKSSELLGGLDILVHAAGVRDRRGTLDMSPADFSAIVDVNLAAAYRLARAALPLLQRSQSGRLIFVTSIAASIARAPDPAYTAAKGGLSALTRSLAVEFGAENLTVNSIAPGWFATEPNQLLADDPKVQDFVHMRIPLKRWGRPEELAPAALFLASPAASFVNGATVTVDGGMSAQM
ncbi:SDR family oxidoreductase [Phyllobacterium sp. YR531]|uniref:SDR family oxidoreductase n=1 Tax=Phyllobacterium sp. YR531 TaxID=1144343 RepID=UPI00026FCB9C|nr:SDR family oxidoreductase [Phyllobacterium sp. YR531]EJN06830.1 dehydrogenase of unknown specificity, short-chain alcohol dehydrogenase [Phyllobacterium sp. YR531]